MRKEDFDLEFALEQCEEHSLQFDEHFYNGFAKQRLKNVGLTQRQFNCVMLCHIKALHWVFDATRYSFIQRLGIAWHFLIGGKLPVNFKSEL